MQMATSISSSSSSIPSDSLSKETLDLKLFNKNWQTEKLEPLDPKVKEEYENFKKDLMRQTLIIMKERIPRKIMYFNQLVNVNSVPGSILNAEDLKHCSLKINEIRNGECDNANAVLKVHLADGNERYIGKIESHKQIFDEFEKMKAEAAELVEMTGNVKLWINLNVPRIEDGNNFGVEIQAEATQELTRVEDFAFNLYDAIFKYYMARAKLASKILKYPNIYDYQEGIKELDEKEWLYIKITKVDMRNNYSMLYDLLTKNWEKVVKPKNEAGHNLMIF